MGLTLAEVRGRRLAAQGLRAADGAAGLDATTPDEVVSRFLAVQSQEYLPAQWGLAQRLAADGRPSAAAVGAAIDRGDLLRTHVLRPTWHFVTPADAGWLIALSAERVHRANGTYYARHGLAGAVADRVLATIETAVADGHRTRTEVGAALGDAGLPSTGNALAYCLMLAELERVVISGASVGAQRTYAPFPERVPDVASRARDEGLAELAERYLRARGPVTERDLSAWSGFGLRDVRTALADAADRTDGRIARIDGPDGTAYWHDAEIAERHRDATSARPDEAAPPPRVDLLQAYDEYVMGYAAPRSYLLPTKHPSADSAEFPLHAMLADGVMCGRWAPTVGPRSATVRIVPWRRMSRAEVVARDDAIAGFERFLGRPIAVEVERVARH
ncbi:winged helix DNA-binding domain-containing protein [Agromyces sp. NPDC056523]|uniref:winged helix DNA-binding domain-containing protein n=1 Tax=Agromyces sp. NPDC056523 TaxID=3345850 RepID=UPI00366B8077